MEQRLVEELRAIAGEDSVRQMEPMSRHTTFRVGGPADVLVLSQRNTLPDVLRLCRQHDVPYYVVGNGSNLLVGDGGIRGVVIKIAKAMEELRLSEEGGRYELVAGAGTLLSKAANFAAANSLCGMEFAAGIPGSVGGAIVMNAGAYGGEIADILSHVTVLTPDGKEREIAAEELALGYRTSCIAARGYIVLEAVFHLALGDPEEIRKRMGEIREQRTAKQPLEYPSAGSTFKRPEGYFAGKLIQDAGLRGYRVGGAQVSEKHCGFVINCGGASAADIRKLISEVTDKVWEQSGVRLEPEVKMAGEFEDTLGGMG